MSGKRSFTLSFKSWAGCRDERVYLPLPRLHLHMAAGGRGGRLLLPGRGVRLPLRPLQIQKEKENGLFSGSAEQHFLTGGRLQTIQAGAIVAMPTLHVCVYSKGIHREDSRDFSTTK